MLALRPHRHLVEAGQGEQEGGQALGHDGERNPGAHFEGVVGAGHPVEEQGGGEGGVGVGDAAYGGAGGTEPPEGQVAGQVTQLAEREGCQACVEL